jgi:hypothetical protein
MDTLGTGPVYPAWKVLITRTFMRVSEGTRTPDRLDHNQELYQLSYAHRGANESTSVRPHVGHRERPEA